MFGGWWCRKKGFFSKGVTEFPFQHCVLRFQSLNAGWWPGTFCRMMQRRGSSPGTCQGRMTVSSWGQQGGGSMTTPNTGSGVMALDSVYVRAHNRYSSCVTEQILNKDQHLQVWLFSICLHYVFHLQLTIIVIIGSCKVYVLFSWYILHIKENKGSAKSFKNRTSLQCLFQIACSPTASHKTGPQHLWSPWKPVFARELLIYPQDQRSCNIGKKP